MRKFKNNIEKAQSKKKVLGTARNEKSDAVLLNLIRNLKNKHKDGILKKELFELLVSDTSDSRLVMSYEGYVLMEPLGDFGCHEIRIYNVGRYFIIGYFSWDNEVDCFSIHANVYNTAFSFFESLMGFKEYVDKRLKIKYESLVSSYKLKGMELPESTIVDEPSAEDMTDNDLYLLVVFLRNFKLRKKKKSKADNKS